MLQCLVKVIEFWRLALEENMIFLHWTKIYRVGEVVAVASAGCLNRHVVPMVNKHDHNMEIGT